MNTITDRFIEVYNILKKSKKIRSQRDFCQKIGVSAGVFTEILKKRQEVGIKPVLGLINTYDIDANWLLRGDDNEAGSVNVNNSVQEPNPKYNKMNCKDCQYYNDMKRYYEDALRYRKDIDKLTKELSDLRNSDQDFSKHQAG